MILWCKTCGAFMGLREPLNDWATDRDAVCVHCTEAVVATLPPGAGTKADDTVTDHDTLSLPALPSD